MSTLYAISPTGGMHALHLFPFGHLLRVHISYVMTTPSATITTPKMTTVTGNDAMPAATVGAAMAAVLHVVPGSSRPCERVGPTMANYY